MEEWLEVTLFSAEGDRFSCIEIREGGRKVGEDIDCPTYRDGLRRAREEARRLGLDYFEDHRTRASRG